MQTRPSAQDFELNIGRDGPQLRLREACDPDVQDCYDNSRRYDNSGRYAERRGCTTEHALDKAEDMGIRRARVVSAGRRTIEIRGRSFEGDRVYVTFGRQRSCPVLEY